jgi:hypothetical protein
MGKDSRPKKRGPQGSIRSLVLERPAAPRPAEKKAVKKPAAKKPAAK